MQGRQVAAMRGAFRLHTYQWGWQPPPPGSASDPLPPACLRPHPLTPARPSLLSAACLPAAGGTARRSSTSRCLWGWPPTSSTRAGEEWQHTQRSAAQRSAAQREQPAALPSHCACCALAWFNRSVSVCPHLSALSSALSSLPCECSCTYPCAAPLPLLLPLLLPCCCPAAASLSSTLWTSQPTGQSASCWAAANERPVAAATPNKAPPVPPCACLTLNALPLPLPSPLLPSLC